MRVTATVPDERWMSLWPDGSAPAGLRVWDMTGAPTGPADLVVLPYMNPAPWLSRLRDVVGLRVVQTLTAGYEGIPENLPPGVTLCIATGVHDASTAELAVGLTIAALRGLGEAARDAVDGRWAGATRRSLADRRVLIVGAGSVGRAIATRLAPFEVSLTRVASRERTDADGQVHSVAQLPVLLPTHDVVILACPLNDATRGLVDAAFLAAMPDGALLVNVARGAVVVTEALLAELARERLTAALDVTDPEPLPPGHPLWRAPGVLISPHVGGNTTAFPPRARLLLKDQLERLASGRVLRNVVAGPGLAHDA